MNETLINALILAIGDRAVFLDFWNKNFSKSQSEENSNEKASKKRVSNCMIICKPEPNLEVLNRRIFYLHFSKYPNACFLFFFAQKRC